MTTSEKTDKPTVGRRDFLKVAAAGAASTLVASPVNSEPASSPSLVPGVTRPTETDIRTEFVVPEVDDTASFIRHPASDYMVDVLKSLDLEYVAVNPGSTTTVEVGSQMIAGPAN